jgi:hypothetical protein
VNEAAKKAVVRRFPYGLYEVVEAGRERRDRRSLSPNPQ